MHEMMYGGHRYQYVLAQCWICGYEEYVDYASDAICWRCEVTHNQTNQTWLEENDDE